MTGDASQYEKSIFWGKNIYQGTAASKPAFLVDNSFISILNLFILVDLTEKYS